MYVAVYVVWEAVKNKISISAFVIRHSLFPCLPLSQSWVKMKWKSHSPDPLNRSDAWRILLGGILIRWLRSWNEKSGKRINKMPLRKKPLQSNKLETIKFYQFFHSPCSLSTASSLHGLFFHNISFNSRFLFGTLLPGHLNVKWNKEWNRYLMAKLTPAYRHRTREHSNNTELGNFQLLLLIQ